MRESVHALKSLYGNPKNRPAAAESRVKFAARTARPFVPLGKLKPCPPVWYTLGSARVWSKPPRPKTQVETKPGAAAKGKGKMAT